METTMTTRDKLTNAWLKIKKKGVGSYIIMALTILFIAFPFYILIITSLMTEQEANSANFRWWPEMGFSIAGYKDVFFKEMGGVNIMSGFVNTLWIYIPGILVGLYTSGMAAFAFAKMRFRVKGFIFSVLLSTMMLPNSMATIAQVMLYDSLGWMNTPFPLMIPAMFGAIGSVFFMRQFYLTIPDDLINAAKVDGLGFFGIYNQIILALSTNVMFAQFILSFMSAYNDYLGPLLFCQSSSMYTLQVALAFFAGPYAQNWPLRMAGVVVSMLPLSIFYIASQKYIRKSLALSASIKG
jgi:multiple sugar transport system permease protein